MHVYSNLNFYFAVVSIQPPSDSFGEWHGNPFQYSCLENPMDRGAWWDTVHGVTKSLTLLKQLSTHAYSDSWNCLVIFIKTSGVGIFKCIIKKVITNDGEDVEGKKVCVLLVGL